MLNTYRHWHKQLRQIYEATERCYKWALYDRDPLKSWGRDRVTLLGDSAHAMLPYLAQGAGQSMEDACVLADVLASSPEDPDAALKRYETLRLPRTSKSSLARASAAVINHLSSPWARFKRDAGIALAPMARREGSLQEIAWIYGYDAARLSGEELAAASARSRLSRPRAAVSWLDGDAAAEPAGSRPSGRCESRCGARRDRRGYAPRESRPSQDRARS